MIVSNQVLILFFCKIREKLSNYILFDALLICRRKPVELTNSSSAKKYAHVKVTTGNGKLLFPVVYGIAIFPNECIGGQHKNA